MASIRGDLLALPRTTEEQYRSQSTRSQRFTLFSHNTSESICRGKREHNMTFQFVWLVGYWTVYSEWIMQWTARLESKVASLISEANLSPLWSLYSGPIWLPGMTCRQLLETQYTYIKSIHNCCRSGRTWYHQAKATFKTNTSGQISLLFYYNTSHCLLFYHDGLYLTNLALS